MSRLIDADKLIEELKSAQLCIAGLREHKSFLGQTMTRYEKFIIKTIEEQPTAFDVDKVVEQLEKQVYEIDDSLSLSARDVIDEEDVFEIVKAGGRE